DGTLPAKTSYLTYDPRNATLETDQAPDLAGSHREPTDYEIVRSIDPDLTYTGEKHYGGCGCSYIVETLDKKKAVLKVAEGATQVQNAEEQAGRKLALF